LLQPTRFGQQVIGKVMLAGQRQQPDTLDLLKAGTLADSAQNLCGVDFCSISLVYLEQRIDCGNSDAGLGRIV
jgi:hypothetical protein